MDRRSLLQRAAAGLIVAACGSTAGSGSNGATPTAGEVTTNNPTPTQKPATKATVELAKGGTFTFTLRPDKAPQTVDRFAGKSRSGYYNDLTFATGAVGIARGQDPAFNNDSQWFIVLKDSTFLDKQYTNFGQVTSGMDVVRGIKIGDKIKSITVE